MKYFVPWGYRPYQGTIARKAYTKRDKALSEAQRLCDEEYNFRNAEPRVFEIEAPGDLDTLYVPKVHQSQWVLVNRGFSTSEAAWEKAKEFPYRDVVALSVERKGK